MTDIHCPLEEAAAISRHEPALASPERDVLFFDYNELVWAVAENLRRSGITPGERIALYLPANWAYPVFLFGVIRAGAVACPLSSRLPREGVRRQLEWIHCTKIIAFRKEPGSDPLPGIELLDPDTLLVMPEDFIHEHGSLRVDLEQPATILFTSGSSGRPRAVLHTYGNHYYSARASNANIRLRSHDKWLMNLPMYHVGGIGILFRCILGGAAVMFPERGESIAEAQQATGATHLSLVPTQLQRLMMGGLPPSIKKVKAILLGGAPIDPGSLASALHAGLPVYGTWGMTETASQVTTVTPVTPKTKRATAGLPLKHCEVKIADDGEILVRGSSLFKGYVEGDAVTRPVDAEGWFATGDLGRLDDDGYLQVMGRKDNMFISGGENIQPEEVEQVMVVRPDVNRVVVVPVEDAEFGARPVAFVDGPVRSTEAWCSELEKILPRFKVPIAYFAWPDDGSGPDEKVNRESFRQLAEALRLANELEAND